jgi:hypothetical protein
MGPAGQKYKGCRHCQSELDVRNGIWRPTKDPKYAYFIGYHMNQLMHPSISANDIQVKYETYTDRMFYNEVLGMSYSGGLRPVILEDVLACTDETLRFLDPGEDLSVYNSTFFGMDCGLGHHISVIDDDYRILYQTVVNPKSFDSFDAMIAHIASIIRGFRCENCVVDFGYGANEVLGLQRIFGDKVKGCEYKLDNIEEPIQYREFDDENDEIYRLLVDRSRTMEKVFKLFKLHKYKIPYREDARFIAEPFFDHYINIVSNAPKLLDERGKIRSKDERFKYGSNGPDHMFHVLNYCNIAKLSNEMSSVSFSKIV